jgi:hypothetical protein
VAAAAAGSLPPIPHYYALEPKAELCGILQIEEEE